MFRNVLYMCCVGHVSTTSSVYTCQHQSATACSAHKYLNKRYALMLMTIANSTISTLSMGPTGHISVTQIGRAHV